MSGKPLKFIGRHERASLTELGLQNIAAKTDTGAYTSCIHCIEVIEEGENLICKFLNQNHAEDSVKKVIFATFKKRAVKSSNGQTEERYAVKTKIKLGRELYTIELTLTNRAGMKYPLLLGRKFLNKRFLVDVSQKNMLKSK
jgi:hypothetical protein